MGVTTSALVRIAPDVLLPRLVPSCVGGNNWPTTLRSYYDVQLTCLAFQRPGAAAGGLTTCSNPSDLGAEFTDATTLAEFAVDPHYYNVLRAGD